MTEPRNRRTTEPGYSYRNLELWKQAQDLAQAVVELVGKLPSGRATEPIARQVIRAATSVPANIAEGHGRFGPASYRNLLSIAKGSACELDSWLDLLRRLSFLDEQREAELHRRCNALIGALTGRMRDLEKLYPKMVREEAGTYIARDAMEEPLSPEGSEVQRVRGSES